MLSETTQRKINITWYHLHVKPRKSTQMNVNTKRKLTPKQTVSLHYQSLGAELGDALTDKQQGFPV